MHSPCQFTDLSLRRSRRIFSRHALLPEVPQASSLDLKEHRVNHLSEKNMGKMNGTIPKLNLWNFRSIRSKHSIHAMMTLITTQLITCTCVWLISQIHMSDCTLYTRQAKNPQFPKWGIKNTFSWNNFSQAPLILPSNNRCRHCTKRDDENQVCVAV